MIAKIAPAPPTSQTAFIGDPTIVSSGLVQSACG